MTTTCSFPGCVNAVHGRGLCGGHCKQRRLGQELRELWLAPPPRPLIPNPKDGLTMLVPLSKGLVAIVDAQDAEVVGRYNWFALSAKKAATNYARTNITDDDGTRRTLLLHVLIWDQTGAPRPPQIDHENTDGLDCRRSNLRAATGSQNQWNRRKYRNNTSGFKGVERSRARGCKEWVVRLRVNGKRIHVGYFDSLEEAVRAHAAAATKYHGDFARTA